MVPPDYLIIPFIRWYPFRVTRLPTIGKLFKLIYKRYSKRWEKRLFKKPIRWIFDFCYHVLKIGGTGKIEFSLTHSKKQLLFDARKAHFSTLYLEQYEEYGYEPDVACILSWLIKEYPDCNFFDVGANWGFFSFYAVSSEYFSGMVHAFEPIPDTFDDLHSLVVQGQLGTRIKIHELALSDSTGSAGMAVVDPLSSGVNRIIEGSTDHLVKKTTLDKLDLPIPGIMKVDVEEHEFEMLKGARQLLKRDKPYVIFENWLNEDSNHCLRPLRLMKDMGYALYYPCWHFGEWGKGHLQADIKACSSFGEPSLCMRLFQAEDRYLFKEQINILAIHRDRLNTLPKGTKKIK